MAQGVPQTAMVLAAGFGERMRPLTNTCRSRWCRSSGRALLDHVLDKLAQAGVPKAVVNVHYLADKIETHVAGRKAPRIVISDERDATARYRRRRGQGAAAARQANRFC